MDAGTVTAVVSLLSLVVVCVAAVSAYQSGKITALESKQNALELKVAETYITKADVTKEFDKLNDAIKDLSEYVRKNQNAA